MKKYLAVLLTLAILIFAVSCAPSAPPEQTETGPASQTKPEETNAPPEADPIVIGTIQDTSGPGSLAGKPNEWGVIYAVEWINENGGVNGRMIELHTRDCQNDAAIAVTNYRELVDEVGVCAIVGPPLGNASLAWVDLSAEDKIPIVGHFMIESCTTDPDTGDPYPYMFLAEPSCGFQSYILAEYGMKDLGVKSVATLYNISNSYAVHNEEPFVEYILDNGGTVLAEETFTWADTDYSAQAQKITALNPDAVLLCDYAVEMATAYDNLRDAGYKGIILGANTMYPPFNTLIKNQPPRDCFFTINYDMSDRDTGIIVELVEKQMSDTGTDYPTVNAGFGWDATMVLYHAMLKADDPTNGEEVRDILENDTRDVLSAGGQYITIDPLTHRPTADMGVYIATYNDDNEVTTLALRTARSGSK